MKKEVVEQVNKYVLGQVRELTNKINSNTWSIKKLADENTALKRTRQRMIHLMNDIQKPKPKVKKEDKRVIWDSGLNYELGVLTGYPSPYNRLSVKMLTGVTTGSIISISKDEVIPYNKTNLNLMSEKHGTVKKD